MWTAGEDPNDFELNKAGVRMLVDFRMMAEQVRAKCCCVAAFFAVYAHAAILIVAMVSLLICGLTRSG